MALRLPSPVHAGQFPSLAGGEYRESPALASAVSAIAKRKRQGRKQAHELQYQQNAFDQQDKMQKAKTLEQTVKKAKQDKAWGLVGGITEDLNRGDDISAREKLRELDKVDPKLGAQYREDIAVKRKFNDKQLQEIAKKKEESMLATYDPDLRTFQRKVGKGTAEYLQWIDDNTQIDDPENITRGPGSSRGMFTQEQAKVLKSKAWDAMTAATSPNNKTAMMAQEMAKPKDMKKWEEAQRKREREDRGDARSEEYLDMAREKNERSKNKPSGGSSDKAVGEKAYERSVERFEDLKAKADKSSVAWGELLKLAFTRKIPKKIIEKSGLSEEDAKELQFHSDVLKRYYEQKGIDPQGMFDAGGGEAQQPTGSGKFTILGVE